MFKKIADLIWGPIVGNDERDPEWCHSCGRMGPCPGESGH